MRTFLAAAIISSTLQFPVIAEGPIRTVAELKMALQQAKKETTLMLAEGTFLLDATLEIPGNITLQGAGMDKTILTVSEQFNPSTTALPDPEMRLEGLNTDAYLLRIKRDTEKVTISHMTLKGPKVHGAIFSWFCTQLHLQHLRIQDTLWSGLRCFGMKGAKIHDCEFIDVGGRWENGKPGVKGGITGGGIFACWMAESEIYNNRFVRKNLAKEREFYGIKVRQARKCHVHHNTIEANFSMEFPFENDEDVEIDYNSCSGTISIPKYAGGPVPKSGRTFHIHHNYFKDSYAIEFVRNGVEIDHNLFEFNPQEDHGNLISGFGQATAKGPAKFHHNRIVNPGRGVIWIHEIYNHFEIYNNQITTVTTATPRKEGLFGFHPKCDFSTIRIVDNRIECVGQSRSLLRAKESYAAVIENNTLENVADAAALTNPKMNRPVGLTEPLTFTCGMNNEVQIVDGMNKK